MLKCEFCGKEIEKSAYPKVIPVMCGSKDCFSEYFWNEIIDNKQDYLIINHRSYTIGKDTFVKGFGGAKHAIKKFDSGEIIYTDNLWTNGDVPEKFWDKLPDNAEFIKERCI